MTSGLPYPGEGSYSEKLFAKYITVAAQDTMAGKPWDTAKLIDEAAKVPLCFHPGEGWLYGFSHDVIGRLVEVLSGSKFSQYMSDAILGPLGLSDTTFFVPPEKRDRLAAPYAYSAAGLTPYKIEQPIDPGMQWPSAFESGGGGLASTLRDVSRFAQMLLQDGVLDGVRILSRKTVDLMRRNHLQPELLAGFNVLGTAGYSYGLGVRTLIDTAAAGVNASFGEWAWDGMLGTWFGIDPSEQLVTVFLVQRAPGGNDDLPIRFMQTVYGAIDD
jgi:CubicO group peptidase (beta-lactamase class C family)